MAAAPRRALAWARDRCLMPADASAGKGEPRKPPGERSVLRAPDLTGRELADALWLAAVQANVADSAAPAAHGPDAASYDPGEDASTLAGEHQLTEDGRDR